MHNIYSQYSRDEITYSVLAELFKGNDAKHLSYKATDNKGRVFDPGQVNNTACLQGAILIRQLRNRIENKFLKMPSILRGVHKNISVSQYNKGYGKGNEVSVGTINSGKLFELPVGTVFWTDFNSKTAPFGHARTTIDTLVRTIGDKQINILITFEFHSGGREATYHAYVQNKFEEPQYNKLSREYLRLEDIRKLEGAYYKEPENE
jgi:hypothetical protein